MNGASARQGRELLFTARKAETWIAAAVEQFRGEWADKSPDYSPWVPELADAGGGVQLLLSLFCPMRPACAAIGPVCYPASKLANSALSRAGTSARREAPPK